MMDVSLHIDRLILDGIDLPHAQRPLLQAAVEGELARLLLAGGLAPGWEGGGAVPRISGGTMQLAGDGDPAGLGQSIARAVYGGIGSWGTE
jgi:hypothetical protein